MLPRCQVALAVALLLGGWACGGGAREAEKAAEQVAEGAKGLAEGATEMARGIEALGKGLAELTEKGTHVPVEPVSFKELQALLPDLAGWQKGKPTGERMTSPMSFSQAAVRYTKDRSTIELKIMDSGFNQMLMAPFAMFMITGYEKETERGYEKSVKVAAHPGWEKWDSADSRGELNAVVGSRFLLTLEGENVSDTAALHDLAGKIDFDRLAALK